MQPDGIVLLHGIFRTHRSMEKLARFLRKNGFVVLNLGYPSTRLPIEDIARHIHPLVTAFASQVPGKLHFVGYSLGGLVIRSYLHQFALEKLGRVVMLGTPNHGSEAADFIKDWWLYKKLYGPAGQQLVTRLEEAERLFGQVHYELGVLAGNFTFDPFFSYIIGGSNDGKVSVDSTKIEGMKDHTVISASHTFFPVNRSAWHHTLRFLRQGTFSGV